MPICIGSGIRDSLVDSFCWFWLHFKEDKGVKETDYWQHHLKESEITSWRGIAFEEVCFQHVEQIKQSLGVSGVSSRASAMVVQGTDGGKGTQIDLVIDRDDDIMNVCDMKYLRSVEHMPSSYSQTIERRLAIMEKENKDKIIHMTLISNNPYNNASDSFTSVISAEDLF